MTWVRLDDSMPEHEKVAGLSDRAFRAHIEAICYSARNLTDGRLLAAIVRKNGWERDAAHLVTAGVWEAADDGWRIHDYLDFNPPRAEVERERESRRTGGRVRASQASRAGGRFTSASPAPDQHPAGDVLAALHQPRPDPDPDPDPDPHVPTEHDHSLSRARLKPAVSGLPDLTEPQNAMRVSLHRMLADRMGIHLSDAYAGHDLVHRGLTETDIEAGIGACEGKGRVSWKYVAAILRRRIEEREAGNDPDERAAGGPRTAGGQPHGRATGARGLAGGGSGRGAKRIPTEYDNDF